MRNERTTCNYALAPELQNLASKHGMRVSATDNIGEVRAIERTDHLFFLGTLFQPQLRSTAKAPHTVLTGLLQAAMERLADLLFQGATAAQQSPWSPVGPRVPGTGRSCGARCRDPSSGNTARCFRPNAQNQRPVPRSKTAMIWRPYPPPAGCVISA